MGQDGVGEAVVAQVAALGGAVLAPQQAQIQHAVPKLVAVLAVVQQGHAAAAVGQVRPFVGADLEFGLVPGGVAVGGPLHMAELDLAAAGLGHHIHGPLDPEHLIFLLPVRFAAVSSV